MNCHSCCLSGGIRERINSLQKRAYMREGRRWRLKGDEGPPRYECEEDFRRVP